MDGRALALSLTPAREAAREDVDSIMATHETRFEQLLGDRDKEALREALMIIALTGGGEFAV